MQIAILSDSIITSDCMCLVSHQISLITSEANQTTVTCFLLVAEHQHLHFFPPPPAASRPHTFLPLTAWETKSAVLLSRAQQLQMAAINRVPASVCLLACTFTLVSAAQSYEMPTGTRLTSGTDPSLMSCLMRASHWPPWPNAADTPTLNAWPSWSSSHTSWGGEKHDKKKVCKSWHQLHTMLIID